MGNVVGSYTTGSCVLSESTRASVNCFCFVSSSLSFRIFLVSLFVDFASMPFPLGASGHESKREAEAIYAIRENYVKRPSGVGFGW